MSDNPYRNTPLLIKVKFKGSKLAIGSSRLANCVVDNRFMKNMTELNLLITAATEVKSNKRTNDKIVVNTNSKRNNRSTSFENSRDNKNQSENLLFDKDILDPNSHSLRDPTTGIISPLDNHSSVLDCSKYYPISQTNKRQFQRLIDILDPNDMEITCDFDLWLWLDAQKYFAPFSYKTHDLNVLSLQDIGNKLDINGCLKELTYDLQTGNSLNQSNQEVENNKRNKHYSIQINSSPVELQNQNISEYISNLSEELLVNNLKINKLIAKLRYKELESSDLNFELESFTKYTEKDKVILNKWRKSTIDIMNANKVKAFNKKKRGGY